MDACCYIYSIENLRTKVRYVGSTINQPARWGNHKYLLNLGKHHCRRLQAAWAKDGADNFHFEILETLRQFTKKERSFIELKWISSFKTYNSRTANVFLTNFENSPETRKKISQGLIKRWSDPDIRKAHSLKMKAIWAIPAKRKIYTEIIKSVRQSGIAKAHQSEIMTKAWTDPKRRKKLLARTYSPKVLQSKAEKMRAYWASSEGRAVSAARSAKLRELWNDPLSRFRHRK